MTTIHIFEFVIFFCSYYEWRMNRKEDMANHLFTKMKKSLRQKQKKDENFVSERQAVGIEKWEVEKEREENVRTHQHQVDRHRIVGSGQKLC